MAIQEYQEQGENFWRVTVHVRSQKDRKRRIQKKLSKIESKIAAQREEKKLLKEATREMAQIDGLGLNWDDIVHLWLVDLKEGFESNASDRSLYDYKGMLSKWTKSWNSRPIASLTRADGKDLLRELSKAGLSSVYIIKFKNLVNRVFKWAVDTRNLPDNFSSPVHGLGIDKTPEQVPDILSLDEIRKLLREAKACGHFWYPIWTVALNTGMRSGELYALTWEQIDFEKNIILCHQAFDSNLKKIGPTKGRYWRVIPISPALREYLLELRANKFDEHFVLPHSKTWFNGDQVNPLKEFMKSIGLRPVKFHALRACWATQMLANGVPAAVVMRIGAWKRTSTMDIYLRLAGVEVKGATDCLDFIPETREFADNVVNLMSFQGGNK